MSYALLYLEHLSEKDLGLLARVGDAPEDPKELSTRIRECPGLIEDLLASPRLFDAILNQEEQTVGATVTPFLVFGALVHRTGRDLETANYVSEWAGPGRWLPVFDVAPLREFLTSEANRYFLIELLASFVKVASGTVWIRTRRGYRRRRYSELDPVRLAEMVEQLPAAQRPGGYRRLGDVVLFLSGVFPDHTATHPPAISERERLAVSAGVHSLAALDEGSDLRFHEIVGASWYRRAVESAQIASGAGPTHLLQVADRFGEARRVLNVITSRHLFKFDTGLLGPAA